MKADMTEPPTTTVPTECTDQPLLFPDLIARPVEVDFEAGHVSSEGGGVLLAQLDRREGYLERFAACFYDYRDPELIEHDLLTLLRQRTYGLGLGYEEASSL